jgi:hypothetical protein
MGVQAMSDEESVKCEVLSMKIGFRIQDLGFSK